jgi:uncharacterized protein YxjI
MRHTRRYKMRQRLISLGEDYDIEDEAGRPAFHVDGQHLRIHETFVITSADGREVATVRQRLLALRETMNIERGGEVIATVRKALLSPFPNKYRIDVIGGQDLVALGNFLMYDYTIKRGGDTVANISEKWFALRDTYGIAIEPGEDEGLMLAIAVVIDEVAHDEDEQQPGEP